jgi:hypothetical protein
MYQPLMQTEQTLNTIGVAVRFKLRRKELIEEQGDG